MPELDGRPPAQSYQRPGADAARYNSVHSPQKQTGEQRSEFYGFNAKSGTGHDVAGLVEGKWPELALAVFCYHLQE